MRSRIIKKKTTMNQEMENNLHPKERGLIKKLRSDYRYGEVTIEMRGGVPVRIAEAVSYEKVDDIPKKSLDEFPGGGKM